MSRFPLRRWTLARRATVLVGVGWLGVVVALGVLFAVTGQNEAAVNDLLNRVGPARRDASDLLTSLVEEQNAVRGYALTGDPARRASYQVTSDRATQQSEALLRRLPAVDPAAAQDLRRLDAATSAWRRGGAQPLLAAVDADGPRPVADSTYLTEELRFGDVLTTARTLLGELESRRDSSAQRLQDSRGAQLLALIGAAVLAAVAGVLTILLVRRWVTTPIQRLAADARRVADGDHGHQVGVPAGPPELAQVGGDVEKMRSRIVNELALVEAGRAQLRGAKEELQSQAVDLMRSNRDLEQFAYVASHDLQEPLRKVAGFCQLLQRRYSGQLDERAEQYIEFAVDGAQRMQQLISELLRFSRVGRAERALTDVPLGQMASEALAELEGARGGASIEVGELPTVHGDPLLLRQLLTNLLGNALKFRRPDTPSVVRVDAVPDADGWLISVADNGIGIEPEFADKIFVLFQRLHSRESYSGTGIGLALAKRIVEFHGGRIWLDTRRRDGATVHFTLPAARTTGQGAATEDAGATRDSEAPS